MKIYSYVLLQLVQCIKKDDIKNSNIIKVQKYFKWRFWGAQEKVSTLNIEIIVEQVHAEIAPEDDDCNLDGERKQFP